MPSSINRETVEQIARLARLNLTDKEVKQFTKELGEILRAFKTIDRAKVSGVKPSFQPINLVNRTRDDEVEPSLSQDEALANTKNKERGFFKGPRVV